MSCRENRQNQNPNAMNHPGGGATLRELFIPILMTAVADETQGPRQCMAGPIDFSALRKSMMVSDASFDNSTKFAGIATVVRNCNEIVIDGINAQVHVSSSFVVECLALRLGSYLIEQHGWQQVIVESDCKLAIQMINRLNPDSWEVKSILFDIQNLTEYRFNVMFSCISRLSNQVAD
ncbi:hypothetical protein V6N12_004903 [Hibiscus sabdariffa]|uniref:RNase H type-1 domain-containing protein n=1 Tax=Hibiscus sabdariffa TaxID=183260 RepID=A0ABR2CMW4_9ROSI